MHRYNSFLIGLNILKETKETFMEQIKNHQDYQLELKQIVGFPRCRIYRDFIRSLVTNKSIRTNGGSFLFYYIVLCSYANYRSSYRRTETMIMQCFSNAERRIGKQRLEELQSGKRVRYLYRR